MAIFNNATEPSPERRTWPIDYESKYLEAALGLSIGPKLKKAVEIGFDEGRRHEREFILSVIRGVATAVPGLNPAHGLAIQLTLNTIIEELEKPRGTD